jgi:hypothetical protein
MLTLYRYANILYEPKGKALVERLWSETLEEFSFVDIEGILNSIKH